MLTTLVAGQLAAWTSTKHFSCAFPASLLYRTSLPGRVHRSPLNKLWVIWQPKKKLVQIFLYMTFSLVCAMLFAYSWISSSVTSPLFKACSKRVILSLNIWPQEPLTLKSSEGRPSWMLTLSWNNDSWPIDTSSCVTSSLNKPTCLLVLPCPPFMGATPWIGHTIKKTPRNQKDCQKRPTCQRSLSLTTWIEGPALVRLYTVIGMMMKEDRHCQDWCGNWDNKKGICRQATMNQLAPSPVGCRKTGWRQRPWSNPCQQRIDEHSSKLGHTFVHSSRTWRRVGKCMEGMML